MVWPALIACWMPAIVASSILNVPCAAAAVGISTSTAAAAKPARRWWVDVVVIMASYSRLALGVAAATASGGVVAGGLRCIVACS